MSCTPSEGGVGIEERDIVRCSIAHDVFCAVAVCFGQGRRVTTRPTCVSVKYDVLLWTASRASITVSLGNAGRTVSSQRRLGCGPMSSNLNSWHAYLTPGPIRDSTVITGATSWLRHSEVTRAPQLPHSQYLRHRDMTVVHLKCLQQRLAMPGAGRCCVCFSTHST